MLARLTLIALALTCFGCAFGEAGPCSSPDECTDGLRCVEGRCRMLVTADAGAGTDACVFECPRAPEGCTYAASPDECACGTLVCDDAGADTDAGVDTDAGLATDAGVDTDACVFECPRPPAGCAYASSLDECSCGTLVCDDAGAPPACTLGGSECGPGSACLVEGCGGIAGRCVYSSPGSPLNVCGCDGVTYASPAALAEAGEAQAHEGSCDGATET